MCPDIVWWMNANALRSEIHRFLEYLRRKNFVFDDLLIMVQIINEHVQGLNPLLESGLGFLPLAKRDNARHYIERPGTINHGAFGINGKGNTHQLNCNFGCSLVLVDFA